MWELYNCAYNLAIAYYDILRYVTQAEEHSIDSLNHYGITHIYLDAAVSYLSHTLIF